MSLYLALSKINRFFFVTTFFCRTSENMTAVNTPNINFKWDPKSLEIRTLAVERLLEPLVTQVELSERKLNLFVSCHGALSGMFLLLVM